MGALFGLIIAVLLIGWLCPGLVFFIIILAGYYWWLWLPALAIVMLCTLSGNGIASGPVYHSKVPGHDRNRRPPKDLPPEWRG